MLISSHPHRDISKSKSLLSLLQYLCNTNDENVPKLYHGYVMAQ